MLTKERVPESQSAYSVQQLLEQISELEEENRNLIQLQHVLEGNVELFKALTAESQSGMLLTRIDGTIIRIFRAIFGNTSESLSEQSIFDGVHPDDRHIVEEAYSSLVSSGDQRRCEARVRTRAGTFRWAGIVITDMLDNPSVGGVVVNYADITGSKLREAANRELAVAAESLHQALFSIDLEGRIVSWNRGAELEFGYGDAEIIGRDIRMLAAPGQDEWKSGVQRRLQQGEQCVTYDSRWIAKSGKIVPVKVEVHLKPEGPNNYGVILATAAVPACL